MFRCSPRPRARRLPLLALALLALVAFAAPSLSATVRQARDPLRFAVEQVRERGAYRYDARIETTIAPQPRLENVGVQPRRQDMAVRGSIDLRRQTFDLSLLQGDGGFATAGAMEIRVADGVAEGRVASGAWQPVELPRGAFAPGSDFLGLLGAARDRGAAESVRLAGRDLTRYTFAIDGRAFAQQMRDELERDLREQNRLVPGMSLQTIDAYLAASGTGELLVDAAGLPVRQIVSLAIPDDLRGQTVSGVITVDFAGFPPAPALSRPLGWALAVAWDEVALSLALLAAVAALLIGLVRARRTRPVYLAVTALAIASMLGTPLLQAGRLEVLAAEAAAAPAPAEEPVAPAPAAERARAEARVGAFALAQSLAAGSDGDGDGLSDAVEAEIGTSPARADSDDDGLSDSVEVLELGTRPTAFDTDGDSLSDGLEVDPFVAPGGQTRYLDPFQADTNRDGLGDFAECVGERYCPDTDGDETPDAWDDDNDGDGVPDRLDSDPNSAVSGGASPDGLRGLPGGAFALSVNGNQAGRPLLVNFTLRPTNPKRLWYSGNVLDWPSDDRAGQIQRVFDTTFGATGNLADGDLRLVPTLEIRIPYAAGAFGGLPVKPGYAGADLPSLDGVDLGDASATAAWFAQWLDQAQLDGYQASVRIGEVQAGRPTLLVYLPLDLLRDGQGGAPVAFTSRMFYRPRGPIADHSARLAWSVQAQTDQCKPVPAADSAAGETYNRQRWDALPAAQKAGLTYQKWEKLSAPERSQLWCEDNTNWQANPAPSIVHTYYDDFYLSGLDVSEEHGIAVGLVAEEPQPDTRPLVQHRLWSLARNLDRTFVAGRDCDSVVAGACQGDGARDITVAEIRRRFDRLSNAGVSAEARWGIDRALRVAAYSFAEQGDMGRLFFGHRENGQDREPLLNGWLNDVYAPARGPAAALAAPTVLVARERTFRSASLSLATIAPGSLTLELGDVLPVTQAGLSWQTFAYQGAGVWETYDAQQHYRDLDAALVQSLAGAPGPTAASPEALAGSARLLKGFYLSLVNGRTQAVALAGLPISPTAAAVADPAIAAPATAPAALAALAESMAGLVVDSQPHRALLAPADAGGLLEAVGRQILYQDGGPALSLLQGIGHLRGARAAGYMLGSAMAGVAATVSVTEASPEPISNEIKKATESLMAVHDVVTGIMDVYEVINSGTTLAEAAKALVNFKSVYQSVKSVYAAQQAASVTGKLLGTINDALKQAGAFAVVVTIVTEVIFFIAKLVALIHAGEASAVNVIGLIVETVIAVALGLIMMSVIAAVVPIGTLIAAVIGIIDAVVKGICYLTGLDESENWLANTFCEGIMGNATRLLMAVFYDKTPLVDMAAEGRLNPTNWRVQPRDPQTGALSGFVVGSRLDLQADVVTTLDVDNYAVIRSGGIIGSGDLPQSTFRYEFTDKEEKGEQRIHTRLGLARNQMRDSWGLIDVPFGFDQRVYTTTITTSRTLDRPSLDWRPDGLYLAEGYASPGVLCVTVVCGNYTVDGSNYLSLADSFVFDVFPASLDGFFSLTDADGDGGFRLAWDERFPDLADADGDGLRSPARGGNDPGDNSPDSDQDGLSDFYELQQAHRGLNPRRADTDGDGLGDLEEIRLGLRPALADVDNDGLTDGEEVAGWEIVYGYDAQDQPLRFRTGSNPLDADTDDDGLLDKREQIYGFNPRVFNAADVLQIESQLIEGDGRADGIVAAGATVDFSAAVASTLRDRFALGLFETDLESTAPKPDLAPRSFRLGPLERANLNGSLPIAGGASTQTALLTRAGAIIAGLDSLSGGRTLWLPFDEAAGPRFADAAPFAHDAVCAGACADSSASGYSGRALLLRPGRAPLRVAAAPNLAAERFTLTAWVNPRLQPYAPGTTVPPPAPTTLLARRDAAGADYALDLAWSASEMFNGWEVRTTTAVRPRLSLRDAACAATVSLDATRELSQGSWSQVVASYDGARLRLYINGVAAGELSHAGGLCQRDVPIEIGRTTNSATVVLDEEATRLDEVSLYPYPLSQAEIQALFSDPVLRLGFNGAIEDGSNLRQPAAVGGAGAITMANSRDGDRVGVFDKKRWVTVGPSSSLDMQQGPGQFTLAAFIRPVPLGPDSGWQGVLGREDGFSTYPSLFVNAAGQLRAAFGSGSALCDSGATPGLLSAGAWSHVAVSYTGTQFVFYIDGVERSRLPSGCAAGSRPSGNQLFVGRTNADATLSLNQLVVDDEGDGSGNAEYFIHWGGSRIWERNAVDVGTYTFDSHFVNGASRHLAIAGDGGQRFELFEDDDIYDDTEIDQRIKPFQVNAAGSWGYSADGRGRVEWRLWNSWFNGDLDEVQVYRVALDAAGARALYSRLNNLSYALHTRLEEPPTAAIFRDGSGNLLTGTCAGSSCPTSGLPGRDGQAARFDGDDAIVVSDRPALDLANGFTVGAWVNLDDPSVNQKIVGKFDLGAGGYLLGVENGQIYGELRDSRGNTSVVRGGSIAAGAWAHLAISASAGQQLIGYVNGVEVGRTALPQTARADAALASPAPGSATLYVDENFEDEIQTLSDDTGDLDDNNDASSIRVNTLCVRLYDSDDYADGSRPVCDDTPLLHGFNDVANSARVYTAPPSYDSGAQALRLERGRLQHLRIEPAAVGSPIFSTISIAAWVRPSEPRPAEWHTIAARGAAGGADGFRLRITGNGELNFQAGGGEWMSTSAIPAAPGWVHVAVTLDGTRVRFYIDGVERGSHPFAGNINDAGGPILIGRMPQCGSGDFCDFFDGHMRDLAIFTRAISAAEVAGLRGSADGAGAGNLEASAADPNGRVVFLPFDGPPSGRSFQSLVAEPIGVNDSPLTIGRAPWAGSFFARGLIDEVAVLEYAADQAGVAELMSTAPRLRMALDEPLGATSFADTAAAAVAACAGDGCPQAGARGRIREAPVFGAWADGLSDIVSVPDAERLDLSRFSIELWLRPEAVRPGEQVILAKAVPGANNYTLSLAPGSLLLRLSTSGGAVESRRALNQGQWNHVVASYDGAQLRLVINGTAEPAAAAGPPALNGAPLTVGGLTGYGVAFNGSLDELSIYGRALGDEEAAAHYQYQESWFDNVDRLPLIIDGDKPTAALSVADGAVLADAPILVGVVAADATSGVDAVFYDDDGDALADDWKPAAPGADGSGWYFTFTPPAPGSYPLRAYAADRFGRQSAVSVSTVRVDGGAPSLALDGALSSANLRPAPGSAGDAGVWLLPLRGVAADTLSAPVRVVASLRGPEGPVGSPLVIDGVDGAWSGDYRLPFPPNGVYTLQVSALDAAGNQVTAEPLALSLDALAPVADVAVGGAALGAPPAPLLRTAPLLAAAAPAAPVLSGTVLDAPRPANPLLLAHFEEPAGTTTFLDSSFAQGRISCAGAACPSAGAAGRAGLALAFDGQADTLSLAGPDTGAGSFALSLWLRPQGGAAQVPLFATREGAATIELRLDGGRLGAYAATGGSLALAGAADLTPGAWSHIALSFDGAELRALLNGAPFAALATPDHPGLDQLWLGSRGGQDGFYQGQIDELAVYGAPLSDELARMIAAPVSSDVASLEVLLTHLKDIDRPDAALRQPAALAAGAGGLTRWSAAVPQGIEGPYFLDLASVDGLGNTWSQPRLWSGEIDTLAPRVALFTRDLGDGTALVSCLVEDYNLDPAQVRCPIPAGQWSFENETTDWYRGFYGETPRPVRLRTPLVRISMPASPIEACDRFGNCATAMPSADAAAGAPGASLIIAPADDQIFTSRDPIAVRGYARADAGLRALVVDAGGAAFYEPALGGAQADLLWEASFAPPADGVYTLQATATDGEGARYSDPLAPTIIVDATAPELAIVGLALGEPGALALTAAISEAVGLSALQMRVAGGAWQDLPLPAAGLGVGITAAPGLPQPAPYDGLAVTVELRATDVGGRTTLATRTITLDTVAPVLSIDDLTLADESAGTLSLAGRVTETVGLRSLRARVDDGPWQELALPAPGPASELRGTLSLPRPGPYDGLAVAVELEATDQHGNTATMSASVVLDTVAPILSIDGLTLADAAAGTLSLVGRVTETVGLRSLRARVDDGPWQDLPLVEAGQGIVLQELVALGYPGPYDAVAVLVELEATDLNGNSSSVSDTVVLDTVAPVISLDSLALADPATGSLTIGGRVLETRALARLEAQLNSGAWAELPLPGPAEQGAVLASLSLGRPAPYDGLPVTARLRATDQDGNAATAERTIVLDTVAPVLAIGDLRLAEGAASLRLSGWVTETVGLSSLRARVDGGAWQELPLPASGAAVALGGALSLPHAGPYDGLAATVELRAEDRHGNSTVVSRRAVLDTTAPALTAVLKPLVAGGPLVVYGTARDGVGVSALSITVVDPAGRQVMAAVTLGPPNAAGARGWRYTSAERLSAPGSYTITVKAVDEAGNTRQAQLGGLLAPVYRIYMPVIRL